MEKDAVYSMCTWWC